MISDSNDDSVVPSGPIINNQLEGAPSIKDSDTENFGADVIEKSERVPVIVDFWAPWCGPCKQLGPLLERLVSEYGGKISLVKINVDENKELAAQMRVQSIPMVVAFKEGRPVDGFSGALPESQLRQFFEKLTGSEGSPIDQALVQASELFASGAFDHSQEIYLQILAQDPQNVAAHAGVARSMMELGDVEKANSYIHELDDAIFESEEIQSIKTAIELANVKSDSGEIEKLRNLFLNHPENPQNGIDLAAALYGSGTAEEAVEILIELVKNHKNWGDDAAKKQLLKIFEALGHSDPITIEGRRKLSAVLFS